MKKIKQSFGRKRKFKCGFYQTSFFFGECDLLQFFLMAHSMISITFAIVINDRIDLFGGFEFD